MMQNDKNYTPYQNAALITLRILIGWHFLYEGLTKIANPNWSAGSFLMGSKWLFSGFFHWLANNSGILNIVDFMNEWGLTIIGLGLILGIFVRYAAMAGALLGLLYYIAAPPMPGLVYSIPMEGSYLIVNKTLIEAAALVVLSLFPGSSVFGLDYYVSYLKNNKVSKKG